MKKYFTAFCLCFSSFCFCQQLYFPVSKYADSISLKNNIPELARQAIAKYKDADAATYYDNLFRLYLVAQDYTTAINVLDSFGHIVFPGSPMGMAIGFQYRVYSTTMNAYKEKSTTGFEQVYQQTLISLYQSLAASAQSRAGFYFEFDLDGYKKALDESISAARSSNTDSISVDDAVTLCRYWCRFMVYQTTGRAGKTLITKLEKENYISDDSVVIKMPDGGDISLTIVRKRNVIEPLPVVMMYNIYPGFDHAAASEAAQRGYVGIVANTRGKRLSTSEIIPFEYDGKDAYNIIDWISKQPWCNGSVAMYGGSYLGFAQWSAVKHLHPALKTIVPQVSVGIGIDYPMQGSVFMSYMLRWIHFVTNNKYTDGADFGNSEKWDSLYTAWYKSGRSFRALDTMDHRPNEIFQRWLDHPSYDDYWKNMTPQKDEFAKINMPVLTITGYWDDDQLGAMYYYKQHHQWNKNANHYLLIGPFDHGGSQGQPSAELLGYTIDAVANISITDIVFQWFDHVLKGGNMPAILSGKVNYEVMGANEWKHVSSLKEMNNDTLTFYLSKGSATDTEYKLLSAKPATIDYIKQVVDFKDKTIIIPEGEVISAFTTIVDTALQPGNKMVFISEPLQQNTTISGSLEASFNLSVNKKDLDVVVDLYAQFPDGKYIGLNENLQRASYAKDMSQRHLLQPNKIENVKWNNTFITSIQLPKGSKIIVMAGVNNNPYWQLNYGSGKDVSSETIADGAEAMEVKWYNSSTIKLPVWK